MIKTILFFLMITKLCLSGTIDPNTPDTKYIEYGNKFTYVGKLCGIGSDNKYYCASAVAINDRFILTAAHVVKNAKSCTININDKTINVVNIECQIEFEEDNFGYNDIAIGYCEEEIGLDFYPDLYEDNNEEGKLCSMSGYGLTGTFTTGSIKSDNHRRAGSNIIDNIQNDLLICSPSGPGKKTSLEFIIASGDSGGGLFIDNKLAGINSCVMATDKKPNSSYGDEGGHTRISKFIPWIKGKISGNIKP